MSESQAITEPLFPEEAVVSESELRGETNDTAEETATTSQPETETKQGQPVDLGELEREAAALEDGGDDDFSDFKELSRKEFEELLEEDYEAATLYQYRQNRYKDHQQRKQKAETTTEKIIRDAASDIAAMVPDIYSDNPEKSGELGRFAVNHGMDPTFLNYLTSPNVRIVVPGKKPILLGKGAASLVKMIKTLHAKVEAPKQTQKPKPRATPAQKGKQSETALTGLQAERHFASLSEAEQEALLRG